MTYQAVRLRTSSGLPAECVFLGGGPLLARLLRRLGDVRADPLDGSAIFWSVPVSSIQYQ